jgi:hypothetical protein
LSVSTPTDALTAAVGLGKIGAQRGDAAQRRDGLVELVPGGSAA